MGETKQSLRVRARLRREAVPSTELLQWNRAIADRVLCLPVYQESKSIALYSSVGNEVETKRIFDHALDQGKKVFFPKMNGNGCPFSQVARYEELQDGPNGILEPGQTRGLTAEDQRGLLLFIPGLAFDLKGNRLGRGGGWYDRVLAELGKSVTRVGLAYECQIVEELPVEEWDQRVHQIVTEKRIVHCGNLNSSSDFAN